jgi:HPt (histidine-containing phosphotransfer) domain-containing protein
MSPEDLEGLSSVIDSKALSARCLNNLQFIERILTMFDGRCDVELAELEQAIGAGDVETVCRISHRFAGACANAAAFELQACASELRKAASKPSLPEASAWLEKLRFEKQKFSAALSARHKASAPVSS